MPRAKLTLTNWNKVKDVLNHYPCAKGREWITKQLKKGMTPFEVWKSCNNPEHIIYVLNVASLNSSYFLSWREREDFDIPTWIIYADDRFLTRSQKKKICNALRSRATWTEVKNGLIKVGWR